MCTRVINRIVVWYPLLLGSNSIPINRGITFKPQVSLWILDSSLLLKLTPLHVLDILPLLLPSDNLLLFDLPMIPFLVHPLKHLQRHHHLPSSDMEPRIFHLHEASYADVVRERDALRYPVGQHWPRSLGWLTAFSATEVLFGPTRCAILSQVARMLSDFCSTPWTKFAAKCVVNAI